jgi:hypothetical protein
MVPAEIQDALLDEIKRIGPENGKRLLEIARSMNVLPRQKKRTLEEILRDLPVWDEERAREMEEIIEAGCEQIDLSTW